jgi:hypothetical protein
MYLIARLSEILDSAFAFLTWLFPIDVLDFDSKVRESGANI